MKVIFCANVESRFDVNEESCSSNSRPGFPDKLTLIDGYCPVGK